MMKGNNLKIISIFIALCLLTSCSCRKEEPKELKLYKKLVDTESEFWYNHSMSHILLNRIISKETQVIWGTNFHTASPVPIGSVGPEKYTTMLKGIIQNDSIGRVLKKAVSEKINVILVIGDGMGNFHMSLPAYYRYAKKSNDITMFEKIMGEGECGYVLTGTYRGMVTGSAASGTAIACGEKTCMNMVGVGPSGSPLESALGLAKRKYGYKTALVSDAGITDATPAVFYAHSVNRDWEESIAAELCTCDLVDVILGGGGSLFIPENTRLSDFVTTGSVNDYVSTRSDTLNLIKQFRDKSYQFCSTLAQLRQANKDQKILGLFASGGLPAVIDRDSSNSFVPTVPEMCASALEAVSGKGDPFFAVIECARIDWEAHDNDFGAVFKAVEGMDHVLKIAYRYYHKDPENTLLIFTADHETGGPEIAYRKVDESQMESIKLGNGKVWTNITNPLMYSQFVENLEKQHSTVSKILGKAQSPTELKESIQKELGYVLSDEDIDLLFYAKSNYKKYKD